MVTDEVLGELGSRYDTDNDRVIDKREAIEAVLDYFNYGLSKEETIAIIRLYFASSSSCTVHAGRNLCNALDGGDSPLGSGTHR